MKFSFALLASALAISTVAAAPSVRPTPEFMRQASPSKRPDGYQNERITPQAQSSAQGTLASQAEVSSYVQPARYAAAAYCTNLATGQALSSDATILYAAGNGRDVQRVYVAYSQTDGVIVAHQGTNTSSISSIENDIDIIRVDPDSRIAFLGDVGVNGGFQDAWLDTADAVLNAVQRALSSHPGSKVLVVGHSLGAAIALYNSLYIQHATGASVTTRLYGLPRAGNQKFADAVDNYINNMKHIVNYADPVPHLPGNFLGYVHPSGEVWINPAGSNTAYDYPGQENTNGAWTIEPNEYETSNHHGPYFGVNMGC